MTMTTEMLDAARRYVAAGLSVIPIRRHSKEPSFDALHETTGATTNWVVNDPRAAWRVYAARMPTDAELVTWFTDTDHQLAIVGGAVSGGLVRIDFEHRNCLSTWQALCGDNPAMVRAASLLPVVETPKGHHVYFRMPDPPAHMLLSSHGSGNDLLVLSETQGEGCYCVASPSVGYTPTYDLAPYRWVSGGPDSIPTFDAEVSRLLLGAARFPGLWETIFVREGAYERGLRLGRTGLWLFEGTPQRTHNLIGLGWNEINALQRYFDRYTLLLAAVEHAPPAPPSYDDDGGYADEEMYS